MTRLRAEETQKLAAFYNAVNESTWLTAVYKSQLTTFYNAVNESAWYSAVYNSQLANFYAAINQSEQQAAAASAAAAAAPAPASSSSTSSGGGGWTGPWACIAEHESGGNPGEDTGNGYYGGLQFSLGTWEAYGGTGNPADASIGEQEAVAERILAAQGWGAWPNTSRECGE